MRGLGLCLRHAGRLRKPPLDLSLAAGCVSLRRCEQLPASQLEVNVLSLGRHGTLTRTQVSQKRRAKGMSITWRNAQAEGRPVRQATYAGCAALGQTESCGSDCALSHRCAGALSQVRAQTAPPSSCDYTTDCSCLRRCLLRTIARSARGPSVASSARRSERHGCAHDRARRTSAITFYKLLNRPAAQQRPPSCAASPPCSV